MEEVTEEQRVALAERRRQERGQHPQGKPSPPQDGATSGTREGQGAPRHPGLCWAERVADKPDLSGPGFSGQSRKQADSPWGTLAPVWLTLLHSSWRAPFADQQCSQKAGLSEEERGMRPSCPLRLEKLDNNKMLIMKPVTMANTCGVSAMCQARLSIFCRY